MDDVAVIGIILLFLFDVSIIPSLRKALFDCFRSNGYSKKYKKINANQNILNRITLNYIYPLLKKYKNDFRIIHLCYKVYLVVSSLLSVFIIFLYFFAKENICLIAIIFCCIFKVIVALGIRIFLFPHGEVAANSVFIKKK